MTYATGDDLTLRFDVDLVGDLAGDDRETLGRGNVPTHPVIVSALSEASGQVNAALIYGGKYSPDDLAGLTGIDRDYLAGLVCDLAMMRLYQRRPEATPEGALDSLRDRTKDQIEALRKGHNIFNLPETVEATVVDTGGPTPVELDNRNDMTVRMHRYFPQPSTRLPRAQRGES